MGERTIKLHCRSTSKTIEIFAWEDERVDLGFIATAFGLDPQTIKLNGRFISRGLDFVAYSVTWNSLLSFFDSKGLSDRPILVDGKLSKLGTKRACETLNSDNRAVYVNGEDTNFVKNKKMRNVDSGESAKSHAGLGLKRKQLIEELSLLKRQKINEAYTGILGKGNNSVNDRTDLSSDISANANNGVSKAISSSSFRCNLKKATKRTREESVDEGVLAALCKRIR